MLCQIKFLWNIGPLIFNSFLKSLSTLSIHKERTAYVSTRYRWADTLPPAKYGGRYIITMIPGFGIGDEIMGHVRDIFKDMGTPIDFEVMDLQEPDDIDHIINSTRRNHYAIKGHLEVLYDTDKLHYNSPNVEMRKRLNLYAYVSRFKPFRSITCKFPDLDIIVVRQNTEGEYSMLEHESVKGVVNSLRVVTWKNVNRIANYAIQLAKSTGRERITVVHKANIIKLTDGLFRDVCLQLGEEYQIEMNDMIVDNACMQIVQNPHQFEIILCPNLYGNIICNILSGLSGGVGLYAASNFSSTCAIFEPTCRNLAWSLKGRNVANPTSFISAGVELLRYLNMQSHAGILHVALRATIEDNHIMTRDVGGSASTSDFISTLRMNLCSLLEDEQLFCPSTPFSEISEDLSTYEQWESSLD